MWYHIPEFKHSKWLLVHFHKHAPFLTVEITQFHILNPENGKLTTHNVVTAKSVDWLVSRPPGICDDFVECRP